MICLAFQHGDSPLPNLSAKNGVLDNGTYHEFHSASQNSVGEVEPANFPVPGLSMVRKTAI
jgi:hypothetical protein